MRNLLIGNGLNLTNYKENLFLNSSNICERFKKYLKTYWLLMNDLFYQEEMSFNELIKRLDSNNNGIEQMAGIVFHFIYQQIEMKRKFNRNDNYRLVEILGEIAIKAIFFKENHFFIPQITDDYINKITKDYENIFTLNYIEGWDKLGNVKYLHGNLMKYINSYCDIGSVVLSHNKEYCKWKKEEYIKIDFKDIVFIPINDIVNKYNYIVKGLYPGDDLFPADDLFPYGGRDVYRDLDHLKNIDIFGMSPHGDEAIIEKIKNIKDRNIYVYELKEEEINEWRRYGINDCFIDSSEFLNS